ncbi:MAG TPA: hypothetical protein VGD71_39935 [Kribbella sp.]
MATRRHPPTGCGKPYPHLLALLDAIRDGDTIEPDDEDGVWRFAVADSNGATKHLTLEEILPPPEIAAPSGPPIPTEHSIGESSTSASPMSSEALRILESVDVTMRPVLTADTAMGGGHWPVLLVEPEKAAAISNNTSPGPPREMQVESIIMAGFIRYVAGAESPPERSDWSGRPTATGLELWDAGGVWARGALTVDEHWISAAQGHGRILVLYGPRVGVRTPPGDVDYTETDRQTELTESRQAGLVAAALIPWGAGDDGNKAGRRPWWRRRHRTE